MRSTYKFSEEWKDIDIGGGATQEVRDPDYTDGMEHFFRVYS
jgi:hypothetical protein